MRKPPAPETTVAPAGALAFAFLSTRAIRPFSINTLPVAMSARFSGETMVTSLIQIGCGSGSFETGRAEVATETANATARGKNFI